LLAASCVGAEPAGDAREDWREKDWREVEDWGEATEAAAAEGFEAMERDGAARMAALGTVALAEGSAEESVAE
jgi:hypothetical protein